MYIVQNYALFNACCVYVFFIVIVVVVAFFFALGFIISEAQSSHIREKSQTKGG